MLEAPVIPRTYQEWKECITIRCQIKLTQEFIARRLEELRDPDHPSTREFVQKYGQEYTNSVIHWFSSAHSEG